MYNISQIYSIYSTSAFNLSDIFRWRNIIVDGNLKTYSVYMADSTPQDKCTEKIYKQLDETQSSIIFERCFYCRIRKRTDDKIYKVCADCLYLITKYCYYIWQKKASSLKLSPKKSLRIKTIATKNINCLIYNLFKYSSYNLYHRDNPEGKK